jgi:acyl carrier protein
MTALEDELRQLIVEALMLEDVRPGDIGADAPLFVEGLGLDSIDALELAMAIERRFGIRFAPDDSKNNQIFRSVRALAEHITQSRTAAVGAP